MLDLVGVLLSVGVDPLHASAFGSASSARLGGVDIVVQTVESTTNDVCGNAFRDDLHVVEFVDLAGAEGSVAESTQSPSKRTLALHELLVQALLR